jgi:hypothetical protein
MIEHGARPSWLVEAAPAIRLAHISYTGALLYGSNQ